LILRARLLALAAYTGSLPHLKGVLVDGNVLSPIEYLESFTVEQSLEGVYATSSTMSQLFVSVIAVVEVKPLHEIITDDNLFWHDN
jgi:hypothetical protein|tara:strand:- start:143 stop:400 length:258 start_codon:yes stop_codon:yes gene_type:complete